MDESNIEFVQETNPNGSISLIEKKKQTNLLDFIKKLEKISPITKKDSKEIITLGLFNGIKFKMYVIKGQYWGLRITLEEIYPNIQRQFDRLCEEYIEEFDCFWLEEDIDYIKVNRKWFYGEFTTQTICHVGKDVILLSVEGLVKLLSRSSKMKTCLFWLIKKFVEYKLFKYQVESFWEKLQKTESPAELYYLCAISRLLDIEKLTPQKRIGKFRGDLVIDNRFLIMIKGRRYHGTFPKIYEDTERERYIQREGYVCITFWAYEIFGNVEKCVNETIEIINKFRKYERG